MNSDPDDAATLLASLRAADDFRGLYVRCASFLRPFEDFIFLDDYNPGAGKKKTRRKPKELPSKEKVGPIARQFNPFLCNALELLADVLRRSDEGMPKEKATELLAIYRLTFHCLLCTAPCLTGPPYSVQLQWVHLVRCLETWNKYSEAEEDGFALLESLRTLLVTLPSTSNSTILFLPDPSAVGSAGADPLLAYLIVEVVIYLTFCAYKSQSRDAGVFKRILALVEQARPWVCIMEPNAMTSLHTILIVALYRCTLFVVEECKSFDDDLVYSFCKKMLKEYTKSPLLHRFPIIAYKICSAIDVEWDRKSSLVDDVLRMSLEISFCGNKFDVAKYVDAVLDFISNFAVRFYLSGNVACKDGSELSLEPADNMQQPSKALELCCKTILKHIQLLCQPQLTSSKSIKGSVASRDSIKGVIKAAFTQYARIIDVLHKLDASNSRELVIKCMCELSVVEITFPNSSLSFPLVKQWIKMFFKDFSDVNEVDDAPFLYSLLLCHCPTLSMNILGEILEQELLAYDQLEAWNPVLCHKMEIKVIHILLMNVFNVRDFKLQRSGVLLRKGLVLRTCGIEYLISCLDCLSEVISLLENITYDSSEAKTLGYHHLASAYFLRAQFAQETKKDWELIQRDVQCAINLLSQLDINAYHTLTSKLKLSAKNTISILCCTLDLLSLKGFLKFQFEMYTLINFFCKYENFSSEKCLAMLWTGRRLGHFLCASPIDPDLVSRISQLSDNNINSFAFWTECLKSSSCSLLMFIQKFLICDSILNAENVQQIESLCCCKLTVEGVKVAVSSLLLDVSAKNEMTFFAGQIYYDLAERLFAGGRVLEGLSYAKEALHLRYKVLRTKFNVFGKRPVELTESSTETNGEQDHLYFELLGLAIRDTWRDKINLERCSLSPWNILGCHLESILQVGIFHEEIGDGVRAEEHFLYGKRVSLLQSLPHFQIAFNCALGQLYRKKLCWDLAEEEFNIARKLLQKNDIIISCRHCKLIFEVTIDMQIANLSTERLNKASHVQSHALDDYRSVLRKLSNDNVEGSFIGSWKQYSICESLSQFNLDAKLHPLDSDRKLVPCHICSFLENSFDSLKVEQQSSTISTVLSNGTCSSDLGCSDGGVFTKVKCLRCLCLKMIKEGTMQNFIHFKWQCQRRRLLLRLLLKIANSLEAFCEKQDAHEVHGVFWQCISVLFDGKPCFDANFHSYDLNLFKLMGDNSIGDIFSVERAALLYNMSWFFLKDIHPEHMSTKCCSLSNVQMQDIISWLLMAFILCREIPSRFQKVSRLTSSLILLSTVEGSIPPPLCSQGSLSLSHWAAFFHQASIGSIVSYQYLSSLREKACNFKAYKGLESENVLECDANIDYISRYAPEKLENLGEFIENFFLGLPRISIICISLLNGDYLNLLGEVLILPPFFPAWLLITRFDGNKQPIIMFLPVDSISKEFLPKSCKKLIHENEVSNWSWPLSSAVIDDVVPSYRLILDANASFLRDDALSDAQYLSLGKILDYQLNNLLKAMKDKWIGPWGCLLLGERLDARSLDIIADKLSNSLNSQCGFILNDNLIKVILSGAQSVFAAEACIVQSLFYKGFFGRGGGCAEQRFRAFADRSKEVKSILASVKSLILQAVGKGMKVNRQPIILVLDSDAQMISWESMPILKNQEVYRMPSLGSILLKLNYHVSEKNTSEVNLPRIDPFRACYLLNPSGELKYVQQKFEKWFQKLKWEGTAGNAPTIVELSLALQNHDLYLYCGHGSGMQYINEDYLGNLKSCAAAFLMGCCSGSLRQRGCYAPEGAPFRFLFSGSPTIIATLWEVTETEMVHFAKAIVKSWTQDSIFRKCNKSISLATNPTFHAEIENCMFCEANVRVASFISEARRASKFPTITGAAIVCYGVPTILKRK